MSHASLVEVTRGDEVECLHGGSVAVVDTHGKLLYQMGDPHHLTFTRSTIKPFQAAPFLRGGGVQQFGYSQAEVAMLCASHSGEAVHIEAAQAMLDKAGCSVNDLRCGCQIPLGYAARDQLPPADAVFTPLHNNCSGKHAGFLAYCVQHGLSREDYLAPDHALQRAVRQSVAHYVGMEPEQMKVGTDGCSAPNYAIPLSRLAAGYARLAQGATSDHYGDALAICRDAMMAYPELISGVGRNDLAFMQTAPGDWVAKIGADGVQVIGVRSAGLGIALKVADGNMRALYTAAVAVLHQLGLVSDPATSPLAPWLRPQLHNFMGIRTGEVRATVRLEKS